MNGLKSVYLGKIRVNQRVNNLATYSVLYYTIIMKTDRYGQIILSEQELCDLYLENPSLKIKQALTETIIEFDEALELLDTPLLQKHNETGMSIEEFDINNQNKYLLPKEYVDFDIAKYVLELCANDSELQRAGQELLMFQDRDMMSLLIYLKYLVDTMREHNIVWGVGRGSSVASFVLFLLGVHKINSLYYDLSLDDFFK